MLSMESRSHGGVNRFSAAFHLYVGRRSELEDAAWIPKPKDAKVRFFGDGAS